jgi:hypothetical protein
MSPEQDMIGHNTSDEFVDRSFSGKLNVIKNHLKMSIFISILLFASLVLPYFLEWYSEPSTVPNALLYFGLNKVWVPVQELVLDEKTNSYIQGVSYQTMKLSTFLVSGCPTSQLPFDRCETYNGLQFATFCYLPLKLVSQLLHLHNI